MIFLGVYDELMNYPNYCIWASIFRLISDSELEFDPIFLEDSIFDPGCHT